MLKMGQIFHICWWSVSRGLTEVLEIDYHRNHGRRTKKLGSLKKAANVKIYIIFDVFGFCGRGTKVDFKDWADFLPPPSTNGQPDCKIFLTTSLSQFAKLRTVNLIYTLIDFFRSPRRAKTKRRSGVLIIVKKDTHQHFCPLAGWGVWLLKYKQDTGL